MKKIDPRSPGASTAGDDHCDPHGHGVGADSGGGHVGMNRSDDGDFSNSSFSRGGVSSDGDAMVEKYRPGKGGGRGGSSDTIPDTTDYSDDS
jgi:hypothetical protein